MAVTIAARERLERVKDSRPQRSLTNEIEAIVLRGSALPVLVQCPGFSW